MGAEEAAYNAELFGTTLAYEPVVVDSREALLAAAPDLAATSDVLVVHIPDADMLERVVETARAVDTLVLNAGTRTDRLRGRACDTHLFHVMASDAQFIDALVSWMAASTDIGRVSVVRDASGDPTPYWTYAAERLSDAGIEVAEPVPMEAAASDPPPAADALWLDLRGSVQRRALDRMTEVPFPVVCPHLTHATVGRATGPVLWHPALFKYGASEVSDRFAARANQPMHSLAYAHWVAMQVTGDALLQVNGTDTDALRTHLRTGTRFDGRKAAPLTFRPWNQQMRHEMYIVEPEANPSEGAPLTGSVAASVPARMPETVAARRTALDALGRSAEASACSLS